MEAGAVPLAAALGTDLSVHHADGICAPVQSDTGRDVMLCREAPFKDSVQIFGLDTFSVVGDSDIDHLSAVHFFLICSNVNISWR